jgi:hypothetical protein
MERLIEPSHRSPGLTNENIVTVFVEVGTAPSSS